MSDLFDDVEFESADIVDGEAVFRRVDPAPYVAFVEKLRAQGPGQIAKTVVTTGEIIQKGSSKGRGKQELSDSRNLQAAASQMDLGLRMSWRHNPDGTTTLRMMLQPKRQFSDETVAKRNLALDRRRLQHAQNALRGAPTNQQLQAKVKEIQDRIDKANATIVGASKPAGTTAKK